MRNRQDGFVQIYVGTDKIDGNAKNLVEFDTLALAADVATNLAAATTRQALLTKLNVPGPYADDTAAATGLVPVGGVYYITTSLLLHTRMA